MPKIELPKSQQDYYRQAIGNQGNNNINPRISQALQESDQANAEANQGLFSRTLQGILPEAKKRLIQAKNDITVPPRDVTVNVRGQQVSGRTLGGLNFEKIKPSLILGSGAVDPMQQAETQYQHMFGKTPNSESLQTMEQAYQDPNLPPVKKAIERFKYNASAQLRAQGEHLQASWVDTLNPEKFPDFQDFEDTIINAMQTASPAAKNTLGNHLQTSGQILRELIKGGGKLISAVNPLQPQEAHAMKYIQPSSTDVNGKVYPETIIDTYHKYKTVKDLGGGAIQTTETPEDRKKDAHMWYYDNGYSADYFPNSPQKTKTPVNLPDLKHGDTGDNVLVFQNWLQSHGFYHGYDPKNLTGVFDDRTQKATEEWQKVNKIPVSGKLDAKSREYLTYFVNHDEDEYTKDTKTNRDVLRYSEAHQVADENLVKNFFTNEDVQVRPNPLSKDFKPYLNVQMFENSTPQPQYHPIDWQAVKQQGLPSSREGQPVPQTQIDPKLQALWDKENPPMAGGVFSGMTLGQTKDIYQQKKGILPRK